MGNLNQPVSMLPREDLSIIVVDDLQFSCEVIKSGLKKAGYKDIRTANSANAAILLLNQRRSDVVVADFWMPEMNGLEMTDLIRRWDENNNRYTGIVLLTAEDTTASIVVAFDRGVDDFLSKSANQFELAARVYGTGRIARQQNALRKKNNDLTSYIQTFKQMSLLDIDTGLGNRKYLLNALSSMINHCETRGGGVSLCLIRISSDEEHTDLFKLGKGTLRTISNSLQLVLRPMDQIVRYDELTFAIAITYADHSTFNPGMFERSAASVLQHTHLLSEQGKKLKLSIASWYSDKVSDIPGVTDMLKLTEQKLKPLKELLDTA